jgi:methionine sulfoxide reductase heme-binding subunit
MPKAATRAFSLSPHLPWLDRWGRVSVFKCIVLALLLLPGLYVGRQLAIGGYARPYILANHDLGLWAIRFLFVALAITPLRQVLAWPKLIQVRRMVGVAAFFYALAHFLFYTLDKSLQWGVIATEIALRYYLTIGFAALVLITALGVTSTDGMVRRLGGKWWARLHRLVYLIGILTVVHFFIQVKADVTEPFIMGGLFAWLMCYRLLARRGAVSFAALIVLAVALSGLTAGAEAFYYHLKTNADMLRVLSANLSLGIGLRPAWLVGGIGLLVALLSLARPLWSKGGERPAAPARA